MYGLSHAEVAGGTEAVWGRLRHGLGPGVHAVPKLSANNLMRLFDLLGDLTSAENPIVKSLRCIDPRHCVACVCLQEGNPPRSGFCCGLLGGLGGAFGCEVSLDVFLKGLAHNPRDAAIQVLGDALGSVPQFVFHAKLPLFCVIHATTLRQSQRTDKSNLSYRHDDSASLVSSALRVAHFKLSSNPKI